MAPSTGDGCPFFLLCSWGVDPSLFYNKASVCDRESNTQFKEYKREKTLYIINLCGDSYKENAVQANQAAQWFASHSPSFSNMRLSFRSPVPGHLVPDCSSRGQFDPGQFVPRTVRPLGFASPNHLLVYKLLISL